MGQWIETNATSNVHFDRVLVAQQGHLSCILKGKKFVNVCVCLEGHQAVSWTAVQAHHPDFLFKYKDINIFQ